MEVVGPHNILVTANRKSANCKKYWVRKSQICKLPHMWKVRKCNKFCKSTNLRIFIGLGEDDSWINLKQKILWHCPFQAKKHQHTQECTDVTSQNFIKILSLKTISLKSNNSIYKITTPSYGVQEEICRRMPRNFFSSTQFQQKQKSLVFFQSINFLWFCYFSVPAKKKKSTIHCTLPVKGRCRTGTVCNVFLCQVQQRLYSKVQYKNFNKLVLPGPLWLQN